MGVVSQEFQDAALVLIGHGSTVNAESSDPIFRHGDAFREQGLFAEVEECFWKIEPSISLVRHQVFARRVFCVPLFISEGYFTQQVIPRELGFCEGGEASFERIAGFGEQEWIYCDPVGTHPSMTRVLAHRAEEVLDAHPFPMRPSDRETTVFIAGHGTGNNQDSRIIIEEQASLLREQGRYQDVRAIFMEEEPRIEACYTLAKSKNVVVVPFFISDGLHSFEDIPVMLGESETTVQKRLRAGKPTWRNPTERRGKRVWYTPSIGLDSGLPEVILERVREAAAWPEGQRMEVNVRGRRTAG